jgi:hypothetical protein
MPRSEDSGAGAAATAALLAIDATLAGDPVEPEFAELAELALILRQERPAPAPEWASALDRRVAARFAEGAVGAGGAGGAGGAAGAAGDFGDFGDGRRAGRAGGASGRGRWRLRGRLRGRLLAPGVAVAGAVAVAVVIVVSGGALRSGPVASPLPARVLLPDSAASSAAHSGASAAASSSSASTSTTAAQAAVPRSASSSPASASAPASAAFGVASSPSSGSSSSAGSGAAGSPAAPAPVTTGNRDVVQSAQLSLEADPKAISTVAQEVFDVVGTEKGIVISSTVTATGNANGYANFQLSVPSANLQPTMTALSSLNGARVLSRTDATSDITGTVGSAGIKLAEARALRRSLLTQLAAATTTEQVDSLKLQLRDADASIASDLATLRGLQRKVADSQIAVTIQAGAVTPVPVGHSFTIGRAARDAGRVLVVVAGIALIALAVLLPAGLVAALAAWAGLAVRRRRREHALDLV